MKTATHFSDLCWCSEAPQGQCITRAITQAARDTIDGIDDLSAEVGDAQREHDEMAGCMVCGWLYGLGKFDMDSSIVAFDNTLLISY